MSDIRDWSPVDNNNDAPPPDGFPEGQVAGSLNNSSREVMAAVRRKWEDGAWFDWGHVVTYVSATSFSVAGDQTAIYQQDRRIRVTMPVGGDIFGRIVSAVFVTSTTVEAAWDSGTLLLESGLKAAVGVESTVNSSIPVVYIQSTLGLQNPGILCYEDKQSFINELVPIGSMRIWPAVAPPATPGTWLVCDGSQVSQTTYAALFALIGHTFGADPGGGNFILPDLRGRTAFGHDAGGTAGRLTGYRQGIDADTIGNAGGEEAHVQASDELRQHGHSYIYTRSGNTFLELGPTQIRVVTQEEAATTGNAGSSAPANVTPPGLVLNWVIRAL